MIIGHIAHTRYSQELATGQPILLDLSDECENENQNFDAWEPDPVDADPCKSYQDVCIELKLFLKTKALKVDNLLISSGD